MAIARSASSSSSSSSSKSWLLSVTIALVLLLTICGEIQTASVATANEATPSVDRSIGELSEPRTFGRIRMMKNVMLPLMFLLGGIKMLLLFLVGISLKTLFFAATIFVINISVGLAKVINFFKHGFGGHTFKDAWSGQDKNVHIHIHSDPSHHLSLEGPPPPGAIHSSAAPTIHSSVFPYSRSDVIEPIYAAPTQINPYNKFYMQGLTKQSLPYSGWQQTGRKLR